MLLSKLILPTAILAMLALCAGRASAQTMGEYATTSAIASGGASTVTSVAPDSGELGGGSRTWGASALGGSWSDRVGAVAPSGADFEARAGSSTNESTGDSRFPASRFAADTSGRFSDSSGRFSDQDRFAARSSASWAERFPASSFHDNNSGVDNSYNPINGN
jgi:hypothetical protein